MTENAHGHPATARSDHARIIDATSFVGTGCLMQAAAMATPFILGASGALIATTMRADLISLGLIPGVVTLLAIVIGLIISTALFVGGLFRARSYACSECRSRVGDTHARICGACRAMFVGVP